MQKIMTDAMEVVLTMQDIVEERGLTYDKIYDIVYEKDPLNCPSRTTISRVFKKGAENEASSFNFEKTLKPIYNALLDVDIDKEGDSVNVLAYKSLLRYKSDLLTDYQRQNAELKEELKTIKQKERERYDKMMAEEREKYYKNSVFTMEQIKLKDARIDELLSVNRENASTVKEVVTTNNKLVNQLMQCPYAKEIKNEN